METPDTIHAFWFGLSVDDAVVVAEQSRLWWTKHPDTDRLIRQRFESCLRLAADGKLDHWATTPTGLLALVLLSDQFPRNMYRNTPESFAFDPLARRWCKEGLSQGMDKLLHPIERTFLYLPLEHSESLEDQERSVLLFEELAQSAGPERSADFAGYLDYAIRHREIVARFGRFPHRNRLLGRASTSEEIAFLEQPGSSF